MIKLFKYLTPYLWMLVLLTGLTYLQVAANLALPDYMAKIINQGIVGQDANAIYSNGWLMLLITLGGGICAVGAGYFASVIGTGFAKKLRDLVFSKVETFSLVEFNEFSTASLITRTTNDIQQIQMVMVMLLRIALMAPFMGIIAIFKAYNLAPSMTWIMATAISGLLVIIVVLFTIAMPRFTRLQKLVDKLNLVTREILTGLRIIRAFDKESYEEQKFRRANRDLTNVNLFVNRLMVVLQPVMMLIMNLTTILIVWVGAHEIEMGFLNIGDMLAFLQYAMMAVMAFLMISIIFIMVPRAFVSGNRIEEVLDTRVKIRDPKNPVKVPRGGGKVEFKNVTFAYAGSEEPVLRDISFVAFPGQTTAFVGSTGSGKSTLVNLIPRFYDVTSGKILVDEVDVRDMLQEDLRARIGYASQRVMLFSGTVKDNITYGRPDANFDEVKNAADISQATEFIEQLDKKFENPIAQAGGNVSGGQKQRLSIARALAKKPEIYIFDDSFSALDFKTEAALRSALKKETAGKTVLIIAQRISTIMQADKILVLDAGKIVGQGTHQELLKSCEVYQQIAMSQLSKKELARATKN